MAELGAIGRLDGWDVDGNYVGASVHVGGPSYFGLNRPMAREDGVLSGVVAANTIPLEGVLVTLHEKRTARCLARTYTDKAGVYSFVGLDSTLTHYFVLFHPTDGSPPVYSMGASYAPSQGDTGYFDFVSSYYLGGRVAIVYADRVKETTTTTGTGTLTLAGAATGFQSFAVVGNGNQCYYCIELSAQWEVGIGTYTASGTTLSRDTVLASSNSGALVSFSAGTKNVFVTAPAAKLLPRTPEKIMRQSLMGGL